MAAAAAVPAASLAAEGGSSGGTERQREGEAGSRKGVGKAGGTAWGGGQRAHPDAVDAHKHFVPGLHQVCNGHLHARVAGAAGAQRVVAGGLEQVAQPLLHFVHTLRGSGRAGIALLGWIRAVGQRAAAKFGSRCRRLGRRAGTLQALCGPAAAAGVVPTPLDAQIAATADWLQHGDAQ